MTDVIVPRNMLFFVCPLASRPKLWRRCCRRLLDHIDQFDGVRTLCVVQGPDMESKEAVLAEFEGQRLDHVLIRENDPCLYEAAHWHKMLETVRGSEGITWFGHTKGVSYTDADWPIQAWVEGCFEVTLGNPDEVERLLCEEHYLTAGPFRLRESGAPWGPWCYSGTFYWFHNRVFERDWKQLIESRWAVEAWPSRVSAIGEGKCLCCDDASCLWKGDNWIKQRFAEVAEWRDRRPLSQLARVVAPPRERPLLNVVTACSRPQNLEIIRYYLDHRLPSFDVRWYVVVDTSVTDMPVEVPGAFLLGGVAHKGFGGVQRNWAIDRITEGLVWFLDDDNIPHPKFDAVLRDAVSASAFNSFVLGQESAMGIPVRDARRENVRLAGVDLAQFVIRRDVIGDSRFPASGVYESDWEFFKLIWKSHAGRFKFLPHATYYNALAPVQKKR